MFNHVHCLQDVDSLSSPKYLGARYTQWLCAQGAIFISFLILCKWNSYPTPGHGQPLAM